MVQILSILLFMRYMHSDDGHLNLGIKVFLAFVPVPVLQCLFVVGDVIRLWPCTWLGPEKRYGCGDILFNSTVGEVDYTSV